MTIGLETSPVSTISLQEASHIADGVDVILRALAIRIKQGVIDWKGSDGASFAAERLQEITGTLTEGLQTFGGAIVGCHTAQTRAFRDGVIEASQSPLLLQLTLARRSAVHVAEVRRAQEMLGGLSLVVVAGRQGSGKDSLAPVFEEFCYSPLTMSDDVKDAASAWGFNRNGTTDKIVAGQLLKEFFGDGILVDLGVIGSVLRGENRLVMFGPRVVGEVGTALGYGGTLIGIAAHPDEATDREIRRARIAARARSDSSRAGDVEKFYEREAIEGPTIAQILAHPQCHLFVDDSPLDEFRAHFKAFVATLLNS